MKKTLVALTMGVVFVLTSCGGGHLCDAYGGQADYTKYKAEQQKKKNN